MQNIPSKKKRTYDDKIISIGKNEIFEVFIMKLALLLSIMVTYNT